jgi:hypothetical protein
LAADIRTTTSAADAVAAADHHPAAELVFACRDLQYSYLDRFPALAGVSLDVRLLAVNLVHERSRR